MTAIRTPADALGGLSAAIVQGLAILRANVTARAAAKAKGPDKRRGREPTARRQAPAICALRAEGHKAVEIARRLSISRTSVFRVLAAARAANATAT
jgi:DNA invertase Pin-like site-specific DNA recombinase